MCYSNYGWEVCERKCAWVCFYPVNQMFLFANVILLWFVIVESPAVFFVLSVTHTHTPRYKYVNVHIPILSFNFNKNSFFAFISIPRQYIGVTSIRLQMNWCWFINGICVEIYIFCIDEWEQVHEYRVTMISLSSCRKHRYFYYVHSPWNSAKSHRKITEQKIRFSTSYESTLPQCDIMEL